MGRFTFRVRRLPDPTPYINIAAEGGGRSRYHGGALSKAQLVGTDGIGAAIDDGCKVPPVIDACILVTGTPGTEMLNGLL